MKRDFIISLIFLLTFFLIPFFWGKIEAASFGFDKSSYAVKVGESVQIQVTIDAGSDELSSADAYVLYDATIISVENVTAGSYFPTVSNNISTAGKIYIAGMVDDPATSKKGTGVLATITFKGIKDGTVNLTYDCNLSKIVKNDFHSTNVLECAKNGRATVTVGTSGSSTTGSSSTIGTSSTAGSSSTTTSTNTTPSVLPRSGIFDNVKNFALPGAILFFLGAALRIILL